METGLRAVHVPLVAKKPENTPLPNVEILTRLFEIKQAFSLLLFILHGRISIQPVTGHTARAPYNPATPSTKPAQQFGAPPSAILSSGSPSPTNPECEL